MQKKKKKKKKKNPCSKTTNEKGKGGRFKFEMQIWHFHKFKAF